MILCKRGFVDNFRHRSYSSFSWLVPNTPTFLVRPASLICFGDLQSFEQAHTDYEHHACWLHIELEENLEIG